MQQQGRFSQPPLLHCGAERTGTDEARCCSAVPVISIAKKATGTAFRREKLLILPTMTLAISRALQFQKRKPQPVLLITATQWKKMIETLLSVRCSMEHPTVVYTASSVGPTGSICIEPSMPSYRSDISLSRSWHSSRR